MDSTIYHGSPLADYLEGHGEAQEGVEITQDDETDTRQPPTFAPSGPPETAQSRMRRVLTKPLHLKLHRRTQTWHDLQDVCSSTINTGITNGENERFLEQYRYLIIASQLLVEQPRPLARKRTKSINGPNPGIPNPEDIDYNILTLNGVLITAISSFMVAWGFHGIRSSTKDSLISQFMRVCMVLMLIYVLFVVIRSYTWRSRSKRLRRDVIDAVSAMVAESHTFDEVTSTALSLVQEIEVVARGYEISQTLPPISRLEEKSSDRRCTGLRTALARSLQSIQDSLLSAHDSLRPFANTVDVDRYHDIYDISQRDVVELSSSLRVDTSADDTSLQHLRFSCRRTFIARQILLCDLLAISPRLESHDVEKWNAVSHEAQQVAKLLRTIADTVNSALKTEDERHWGDASHQGQRFEMDSEDAAFIPPATPGKERARAQMRRLDAMSYGIRALHAKIHILRDEANALVESTEDSSELSSALSRQYDLIGNEIRGLLAEWDKGRNTMLLGADRRDRLSSRSSSGWRSPMSPAPSLGGRTAVEGSPADALKSLTGETFHRDGLDNGPSDEEVFEAIAIPRKRMSMTREEKITKMQEDRRKRATFHEQANTNTSMLRELETVIKHRPRGRTTSRIISV